MSIDLDDYIDVPQRIAEFRTKHPEGSLQQVAIDFREVAGSWWVVFTAAAFRSPDDARPGHGTAWEPIPGKTPYTRGSEVQNAETSAWGRAIVAALVADTSKAVASRQEVRNRREDQKAEERLTAAKRRVAAVAPKDKDLKVWVPAAMAARGLDPNDYADLIKLAEELEGAK